MDIIGVQALYLRPPAVVLTKEGSRDFTDIINYGWHWRTGPPSSFLPCCRPEEGRISEFYRPNQLRMVLAYMPFTFVPLLSS
ncbi:hypothetical protein [Sphingobacterium mizutaii]|uniref:hypothetical protein n=1 Tax=Sphingobacterium mizutaii TaxID=1010 RepID=UPI00162A6A54|nr:hypothetical protein [Sphingobacterium mizutaii]